MTVSGWSRYLAALGLSLVIGITIAVIVGSHSAAADGTMTTRNARYIATSDYLNSGYTLPVRPIPPVPPWAGATTESDAEQVAKMITGQLPEILPTPPAPEHADGCPGQVRAIVRPDDGAPFVILSVEGESALLRMGEGFKSPRGWVAISRIGDDRATVKYRGVSHECSLSDKTE